MLAALDPVSDVLCPVSPGEDTLTMPFVCFIVTPVVVATFPKELTRAVFLVFKVMSRKPIAVDDLCILLPNSLPVLHSILERAVIGGSTSPTVVAFFSIR